MGPHLRFSEPTVWNYTYDGGSNLTAVDLNGVSWRGYVYVAGGLSAATDAAGNLIESHTYNDDGYAISSVGPSGDVSSLGYAFGTGGTYTTDGGLQETEDTAQTTWTSGAVTTSTIRFIAGRPLARNPKHSARRIRGRKTAATERPVLRSPHSSRTVGDLSRGRTE